MFQSILDDVRAEFQKGNTITRLIFINVFVFIATLLLLILSKGFSTDFYSDIINGLSLSNNFIHNITHPWNWVTHMFLHEGVWHLLWNMLFLYWFGRIVGDLIGDHHILPLYLYGGLVGGLIFVLTFQIVHPDTTHFALGASAATMSIVLAAGAIAPDYLMRLILIGTVKLKYIVFFILLFDIVGVATGSNPGGSIAHLGGAAMGWFYIYAIRSGVDLGKPILKMQKGLQKLFGQKPMKRSHQQTYAYPSSRQKAKIIQLKNPERDERDLEEQVDAILDKIREKGYDQLTEEEKETLILASKKD